MARKFKDKTQQKVYDMYRTDPPDGGRYGGGLGAAYRRGIEHPDHQQYLQSSLAYAAWAAGVDKSRQEKR